MFIKDYEPLLKSTFLVFFLTQFELIFSISLVDEHSSYYLLVSYLYDKTD
jgi:hypothetical protein